MISARRRSLVRPACVVLATLLPGGTGTRAADAPDALAALNARFRAWYAAEKARRLEAPGPVLMVKGDVLVLRRGATRREVPLIPAGYHRLKAMAHVPLALEVRLAPLAGRPLADDERKALAEYRPMIDDARLAFEKDEVHEDARLRARAIASASRALLDEVAARGAVDAEALQTYVHAMAPLVLDEARAAADLELTALDAAVRAWRRELGPDQWEKVHAVVMGAHMARDREIAMQYFLDLFGEHAEGGHVIFLEGAWDEAKALDLLATHLVDGEVGRAFFDDPARMHRDLLSDAAGRWIATHRPER